MYICPYDADTRLIVSQKPTCMRKLLQSVIIAAASLSAVSAMADLNGSGYYRVQNAVSKRYAYLLDDKGYIDKRSTSADVRAIELYTGFLRASSDPATVLYLDNIEGSQYDVAGQGTSLHQFLDLYMKLSAGKQYDGQQAYYAYGNASGLSKYLGDYFADRDGEEGLASVEATGDARLWYIHPMVTDSSDAYFGVAPTLTAGGKYYYPLFTGFPYSTASAGMKMYIVAKIDGYNGVAVIKEVNGVIPSGCAVIVECSNPLAVDNRMNVGSNGSAADVSGNALKGVYFNNCNTNHVNQTVYDKASMRLLAVKDGKLVFETSDFEFVPRNQAYLYLPDASMHGISEYKVMTESEYQAYVESIAAHNPDGYYRMQNASTNRYVSISGNTGSLGTSPVLRSLSLLSDVVRVNSDPSTVLYMSKPSSAVNAFQRNLATQGTSFHDIFGSYLTVSPDGESGGLNTYLAEANTVRLGDAATGNGDAVMSSDASGDARKWWFKEIVNQSSGNYFGVVPTVTAGGKYYAPFMAGFPFKVAKQGMAVYTITSADSDLEMMVIQPVSGVIPAGTPVIIECVGPLASDNILEVGASGAEADVKGNMLKGVYFDSEDNSTPYDASVMRSLAVADGKLVFAVSNAQFVPRNQAYISLNSDIQKSVGSYSVVTQDEYDARIAAIVSDLPAGYYRMQNAKSGRNLFVLDDKASLGNGKNANLGAFRLYSDMLRANTDPASVVSLEEGNTPLARNLSTQGTSFYKMTKNYLKILPDESSKGSFNVYTVINGVKNYIGESSGSDDADVSLALDSSVDASKWNFKAVDSSSDDDWFGVAPTVTAGGKYYYPFMADFPVMAASDGVKLYDVYIIDTKYKAAVLREVEGEAPARTPLIVECASPLAADNRLAVGEGENPVSLKGNYLKGVWFDSDIEGHVNRTAYDSESMRILGVNDEGLAFVKGDCSFLPRNQAYLPLSGMSQQSIDEYRVLTVEEYVKVKDGVDIIGSDDIVDVYRIDGTLVKKGMVRYEVPQIGAGVYILRSGSASEKVMVR